MCLDAGEGGLPRQSVVVVSQIVSVEKGRLGPRIGALSAARVEQISDAAAPYSMSRLPAWHTEVLACFSGRGLQFAHAVGYRSVYAFSSAFRRELGCSPSAFRRRSRGGSPPPVR